MPFTSRETLTTANVDPVRTVTLSLRTLSLRARLGDVLATTLPLRTTFSPEIVKRSSGLVHESASWADRELRASFTLWALLLPWASTSLNVFSDDRHVSVVSISFITDCSALLSGSGK